MWNIMASLINWLQFPTSVTSFWWFYFLSFWHAVKQVTAAENSESLPLVYDPDIISLYWGKRPRAVATRIIQLLSVAGGFLSNFALDLINGKIKEVLLLHHHRVYIYICQSTRRDSTSCCFHYRYWMLNKSDKTLFSRLYYSWKLLIILEYFFPRSHGTQHFDTFLKMGASP